MKNYQLPSLKKAARRSRKAEAVEHDVFALSPESKNFGRGLYYFIVTHGCQANERDSEIMGGILREMGYRLAKDILSADLILINTCAIRQNAEERVFGELGALLKYKKENPHVIIGLCGCMAQEEKTVEAVLRKYPQVNLIFGTHNLYRLPELLIECKKSGEKVVEIYSQEGEIIEKLPSKRNSIHKAWVNIMYGCDKFCTYCIVPYTRGKERSRRIYDIIDEIKKLKAQNYREVCLLGQNVNAYGLDIGMEHGFAELLEAVAKTGIERIRFMTPHPRNFDQETIDVMAKYENIMPAVHLPVQSGSNRILQSMKRSYTREEYLDLFKRLKEKIPGLSVTSDIIVGFPNETEEDFQETLSLYDICCYDAAYTFIYSPRIGTPAAKMCDKETLATKEAHLQILNQKVTEYAKQKNESFIGKEVLVLCDGLSRKNSQVYAGYTPENKLVNFTGKNIMVGDIVKVRIDEARSFSLLGTAIEIILPFSYNK